MKTPGSNDIMKKIFKMCMSCLAVIHTIKDGEPNFFVYIHQTYPRSIFKGSTPKNDKYLFQIKIE